jgi:hypothetical protein
LVTGSLLTFFNKLPQNPKVGGLKTCPLLTFFNKLPQNPKVGGLKTCPLYQQIQGVTGFPVAPCFLLSGTFSNRFLNTALKW